MGTDERKTGRPRFNPPPPPPGSASANFRMRSTRWKPRTSGETIRPHPTCNSGRTSSGGRRPRCTGWLRNSGSRRTPLVITPTSVVVDLVGLEQGWDAPVSGRSSEFSTRGCLRPKRSSWFQACSSIANGLWLLGRDCRPGAARRSCPTTTYVGRDYGRHEAGGGPAAYRAVSRRDRGGRGNDRHAARCPADAGTAERESGRRGRHRPPARRVRTRSSVVGRVRSG